MRLRAFAIAALFAATAQAQVVWVRTTMAGKPTCEAGIKGRVFEISDATTESDCSIGGATGNARKMSLCWCVWTAGTSAYEWQAIARGAGVADHGALTGLSDDDHSQYTLLAGRGSGQSLTGAVGTSGYLKFNAHSGDGLGSIYFSSAVNTDTGTIRLVYGGSGIYNGAMYNYGRGTHFVTCAGVGGGAGMIGCTDDNDHYVVSRGFVVSTDGTFPGVAIRGASSSASGVTNQFVGLQMASDTKIGWVNATNLTFSPTADLFIDRDRASMLRVSSTTDGTGGATLLIVPTDTAPTCNKKGIQWERSSVDALCRCNGSTWDKLAGAGSCP